MYMYVFTVIFHITQINKMINSLTIAELLWQVAIVVKISQLPVSTVDPNVHTGAFFTGFYCHFDHPEQHKTKLLPVKNGWLIYCINILNDFYPCSHRRVKKSTHIQKGSFANIAILVPSLKY